MHVTFFISVSPTHATFLLNCTINFSMQCQLHTFPEGQQPTVGVGSYYTVMTETPAYAARGRRNEQQVCCLLGVPEAWWDGSHNQRAADDGCKLFKKGRLGE